MKSVKVRESKFGKALVIETSEKSGGYVLGFKSEPESDLERIATEIKSIKAAFEQSPIFGIDQISDTPQNNTSLLNTSSSYSEAFSLV